MRRLPYGKHVRSRMLSDYVYRVSGRLWACCMSSGSRYTGKRPVGPQPEDAGAKAVCVCPHCERKIRYKAKHTGKQVKCPGCGNPLTLDGVTEFPRDDADRPDRVSSVAGWVVSAALHGLLLVGISGVTWFAGFGTGAGERSVGVVAEGDAVIEAGGGGGLAPIEPAAPDLTPPEIRPPEGDELIELGSSAAAQGAPDEIEIGPLDGGLAGPSADEWDTLGAGEGGAGGGGASFFGLEASGNKFVFVVDRSGSMRDGFRLEAAKAELIRVVSGMDRTMKFFIIFYNTRFEKMPAEGLVGATEDNRKTYLDWVRRIGATGNTDPTDAMLEALSLKPDAIWLLSDGLFPVQAATVIRQKNPGARVQIHTIALHDDGGKDILAKIAEENRGHYKFVPAPASAPVRRPIPVFRGRRSIP